MAKQQQEVKVKLELTEEVIDDITEAHFTSESYDIGLEGTALVDASPSFSLGHEIVEYQ